MPDIQEAFLRNPHRDSLARILFSAVENQPENECHYQRLGELEADGFNPVLIATILEALESFVSEAIIAITEILNYWIDHPKVTVPAYVLTLQCITGMNLLNEPGAWVV